MIVHSDQFLKENNFNGLEKTLLNLHNGINKNCNMRSNDYRSLAYDEIFSNLLFLSQSRKIIKVKKKNGDKKKINRRLY